MTPHQPRSPLAPNQDCNPSFLYFTHAMKQHIDTALDLINSPWTHMLVNTFDRYGTQTDVKRVKTLLRWGASPWASGKNGKSVLCMIISRTPQQDCIDAWFDAAGDLSKAPWETRKQLNPFMDTLFEVGHSESIRKEILLRLLDSNANFKGADLPGHSLIERIWNCMPETKVELITAFLKKAPSLGTSNAAVTFLNQRSQSDKARLGYALSEVDAHEIDRDTHQAMAAARPQNRL